MSPMSSLLKRSNFLIPNITAEVHCKAKNANLNIALKIKLRPFNITKCEHKIVLKVSLPRSPLTKRHVGNIDKINFTLRIHLHHIQNTRGRHLTDLAVGVDTYIK